MTIFTVAECEMDLDLDHVIDTMWTVAFKTPLAAMVAIEMERYELWRGEDFNEDWLPYPIEWIKSKDGKFWMGWEEMNDPDSIQFAIQKTELV